MPWIRCQSPQKKNAAKVTKTGVLPPRIAAMRNGLRKISHLVAIRKCPTAASLANPASATQYSQHLIRPIGDDAPDTFVNQQTHPTRVVHRPDIDVHASFVRSSQEGRTGEIDSQ